jgi:hypothetical protein
VTKSKRAMYHIKWAQSGIITLLRLWNACELAGGTSGLR